MNRYQASTRQAGELALVNVLNAVENPLARGKWRPAVLIRHDAGHWKAMGLTTNSTYVDGTPRVPIPNSFAVGLHGPGFLWGENLTRVSVIDVGRHIGWVDPDLADAIITLAGLVGGDALGLRETARLHHPPTGSAA